MGIVTNPQRASEGLCYCHVAGNSRICYNHGVIGALSKEQETGCREIALLPESNAYEHQVKKFKDMGEIMHVCAEKNITDSEFYGCVAKEATKMKGGDY